MTVENMTDEEKDSFQLFMTNCFNDIYSDITMLQLVRGNENWSTVLPSIQRSILDVASKMIFLGIYVKSEDGNFIDFMQSRGYKPRS